MNIITKSVNTYGLEHNAISFNGGKDGLVILYLFLKLYDKINIPVIFIKHNDEFDEIIEYVDYMKHTLHLNLFIFNDFKESINFLIQNYNTKAILMGCRIGDPCISANNDYFHPTDSDWPQIMRIYPILDWSYNSVWNYIIENDLPYCNLYDQGYTSIGNKKNTFKNYLLFDHENKCFSPCHTLGDSSAERLGRTADLFPINVSGVVVHGKKIGRQLGFPTANLEVCNLNINDGIYYGYANYDDYDDNHNGEINYRCVISVGKNIHFDNIERTFEVHILDNFDKNIYGKILKVKVVGFIRNMKKFDNNIDLVNCLKKDIEYSEYVLWML
jgi:FAD synthetase